MPILLNSANDYGKVLSVIWRLGFYPKGSEFNRAVGNPIALVLHSRKVPEFHKSIIAWKKAKPWASGLVSTNPA